MFDELTAFEDPLEMRWVNIAAMLLSFCAQYAPPANAWRSVLAGEPWGAILEVEAKATAELIAVDPELFAAPPTEDDDADDTRTFSFATPEHIAALQKRAELELASGPFSDQRLSLPAIARGLAGAIDNLIGATYVQWFKNIGELKLEVGKPYPIHGHDPRPWLGRHKANTNPANLPSRNLAWTHRLRIAEPSPINYVIDFEMWNRLSPIGAERGLVAAVAQPNHHLGEFDIRRYPKGKPTTYANRGPRNRREQTARVKRLVDAATAKGAEVIVMPEYTLTEEVRDDLREHISRSSARPLLLCVGISGSQDTDDYVSNEAWLLAVTPGMERSYSPHAPAKIYGAQVDGLDERIHAASEVRVFLSENWTVAALICRDAMDDDIVHQLAILGTNLLLVPAMSQKTGAMVGAISALCHKSQAFIAMANGPASWTRPMKTTKAETAATHQSKPLEELNQKFPPTVTRTSAPAEPSDRCEGFFAGPYASHSAAFLLPHDDHHRKPRELGLWVFSAADRAVRRIVVQ